MALKSEINPRHDRFLPIIKKIHDEVLAYLVNIYPSSKFSIIEDAKENFLTTGPESIPGSIANYKNNNLYSFMIEEISIARADHLLSLCRGEDIEDYEKFFMEENAKSFPYVNKIIIQRKFQKLKQYNYQLNFNIFEVADHMNDMLEVPAIAAQVRQQNLMPKTVMTLEDFNLLKIYISSIESKLNLAVVDKKSLKEVPWESIKDKEFKDAISAKKPPYEGVIPSGTTFVEGKNFKWVDLTHSSNVYTFSNTSNENRLNAPYECFYARHCGKDFGNRLLSLRFKVGNGWYPVALATLKVRGNAYNLFEITQLKTYANNLYWSPDEQAMTWLRARGLKVGGRSISPTDDLYLAVKALLLSPNIASIFDSSDLNLHTFREDKEINNKFIEEFKKYIMYGSDPSLAVGRLEEILRRNDISFVATDNFTIVKNHLENLALNHFVSLIKVHFPEYTGPVSINVISLPGARKEVVYRIEIKSFTDLYDAEDFYWNRFPELRQNHEAGSGDRVRYKTTGYEDYEERIAYGSPPNDCIILIDFSYYNISAQHVNKQMIETIKLFRKRWLSFYQTKKNPSSLVKTKEDEAKWRRAVRSAERKFKLKEKDFTDRQWKYVMGTYKRMKHI